MEVENAKYGLVLGVALAAFIISLLNATGDGGILERLGDWISCIFRRRHGWDECPRLNAAREFLRAKLLTGGYCKHHAFYIAGDGRVFVADAVDFQFALFAGVEDFWHMIARAERQKRGAHLLAIPLQEINFGDGECAYTCVNYCGGITYIDIAPIYDLSYPYRSFRATADEFKQAIVEAKKKAAASGNGNNDVT